MLKILKNVGILTLIILGLLIAVNAAHAKDAPVDIDCQKMASNAKSFATLRATGLATTPEQFASFVVTPVVQSYPIKAILQYVFDSTDKNPDQVYQALYGRCTIMGYKDLYSYFQDREATAKVQAQLEAAQAQLSSLQIDNRKLTDGYNNMRTQLITIQARPARTVAVRVEVPPPAPTHVYGAPISEPIAH